MTIDQKTIEDRINGLTAELRALESSHNTMIQEFQENIASNRTRHAQIQGAITELEQLAQPKKNSEPAGVRHGRVTALERAP